MKETSDLGERRDTKIDGLCSELDADRREMTRARGAADSGGGGAVLFTKLLCESSKCQWASWLVWDEWQIFGETVGAEDARVFRMVFMLKIIVTSGLADECGVGSARSVENRERAKSIVNQGLMRGPRIVSGITHDVSFDGIQMDITQQRQEVLVDIEELGFVSPREQMTRRTQRTMWIFRIAHRNALHRSSEWLFASLHERMQVVRHPAECMNAAACALENLLNDTVEPLPVARTFKERLAIVTSKDPVLEGARNMQSRRSLRPCRSAHAWCVAYSTGARPDRAFQVSPGTERE